MSDSSPGYKLKVSTSVCYCCSCRSSSCSSDSGGRGPSQPSGTSVRMLGVRGEWWVWGEGGHILGQVLSLSANTQARVPTSVRPFFTRSVSSDRHSHTLPATECPLLCMIVASYLRQCHSSEPVLR
jgi:hypothetical protein